MLEPHIYTHLICTLCVCVRVRTYMCMHACICVHACVCMRACMRAYVCMHACMHGACTMEKLATRSQMSKGG